MYYGVPSSILKKLYTHIIHLHNTVEISANNASGMGNVLLDTDEMFSLHSAGERRSVQINQVGRMRSFVFPAVIQNLPH